MTAYASATLAKISNSSVGSGSANYAAVDLMFNGVIGPDQVAAKV
jgi:hypothetical protein